MTMKRVGGDNEEIEIFAAIGLWLYRRRNGGPQAGTGHDHRHPATSSDVRLSKFPLGFVRSFGLESRDQEVTSSLSPPDSHAASRTFDN